MGESTSHIDLTPGNNRSGGWMKMAIMVLGGLLLIAVLLIGVAMIMEGSQRKDPYAETPASSVDAIRMPQQQQQPAGKVLSTVTNLLERLVMVNLMVDRPITNIIERTVLVEMEVEQPVTNMVVKPVEVTVDYPVTNVIVKPQLVLVEMPVTNVVVQPYEVTVDYPITNVVVQPCEIQVDVPVTNMVVRPFEVMVDVPVTNMTVHPVEIIIDKVVTNIVRIGEKATQRVQEAVAAAPVEPPNAGVASITPIVPAAAAPAPVQVAPPHNVAIGGFVVRKPIRLTTPYRVRYGDTLGALAVKYGFRIPDFKVYNPHIDIERIQSGRIIQLPGDLTIEPEK